MKNLLLLCALLFCTLTVNAQDDAKKNWFAVEAGVGGYGEIAVDLSLRWQHNFHPYIGWDVLTLSYTSEPGNLFKGESFMPQLMTGIRLMSPEFSGLRGYLYGRAGYGGMTDMEGDDDGVAFEIGAGINLTRHLYVGYAYNHQALGSVTVKVGKQKTTVDKQVKYHSFRIGWAF